MKFDNLKYEKQLYHQNIKLIAGVDEVGRGPLVGPVVAAAVILPPNYVISGLTDSKKLSEKKRNYFYHIIMRDAISVGIGKVSAQKIDQINIYEASKLAMVKALRNLKVKPQYVLTDALKLNINLPHIPIIHGDLLSLSISAASVIAKVTRDQLMYQLQKRYPQYGFNRHKGYPTKLHLAMLKKYGPLANYRFTYKPVRDLIEKEDVKVDEVQENKRKICN